MFELRALDELAEKVASLIPRDLKEGAEDVKSNVKSLLRAGLRNLDLVTREEFEVQRAVLLRTREKLEVLEARLKSFEELQRKT
jgi:hypothetical protein